MSNSNPLSSPAFTEAPRDCDSTQPVQECPSISPCNPQGTGQPSVTRLSFDRGDYACALAACLCPPLLMILVTHQALLTGHHPMLLYLLTGLVSVGGLLGLFMASQYRLRDAGRSVNWAFVLVFPHLIAGALLVFWVLPSRPSKSNRVGAPKPPAA